MATTTELPSTISEDPTTSNDKVATNEVGFTTVVEEVPLNTDAINLLVEEANGESCCIDKESVLDLSHNQFKEISGIEHLTKLRALSYAGNSIRTIKNLEKLEYLEILNVSSNQIMVAQSLRMLRMNKLHHEYGLITHVSELISVLILL
ncbi:unnamed protein product, partial [Aphanomyces euteiches]